MLLNAVVVGKGCKITVDKNILTEPSAGYDSVSVVVLQFFGRTPMRIQVLGEVGARFNYGELMGHNNLVMYDIPC